MPNQEQPPKKPEHTIKKGSVKLSVWFNDQGYPHGKLEKLYKGKDDQQWRSTDYLRPADAMNVIKTMADYHSWADTLELPSKPDAGKAAANE